MPKACSAAVWSSMGTGKTGGMTDQSEAWTQQTPATDSTWCLIGGLESKQKKRWKTTREWLREPMNYSAADLSFFLPAVDNGDHPSSRPPFCPIFWWVICIQVSWEIPQDLYIHCDITSRDSGCQHCGSSTAFRGRISCVFHEHSFRQRSKTFFWEN